MCIRDSLRLPGGQSGTRRKAHTGKAEGRPVGCLGAGKRPNSPEAVSEAAETAGPAGLSRRLPGFWARAFSYQELPGSLDRPAAEDAVFFFDGCRCFSFIPLLMYWANCSGTSLVQRVYLTQNQLYYAGYSGSMEERVEFTFTLLQLKSYRVGKRAIRIRGQFTKKTKDAYGTYQKGNFTKMLWLPRTFSLEQERALLEFLRDQTAQVH